MQDISNSRDKLNPKFLEGLERFENLLKSKLAPKPSIYKGEKITGEGKYLLKTSWIKKNSMYYVFHLKYMDIVEALLEGLGLSLISVSLRPLTSYPNNDYSLLDTFVY